MRILNIVQEGSESKDEFEKNAEDLNKPTKDVSEAISCDIVPEQPRIMTAGSNDEIHNIQSMDVGPDDKLTSHPNESMKNADRTASLPVQHTSFGRCIGRKFQIRPIFS